jgi:prepilin peptidase CpaA
MGAAMMLFFGVALIVSAIAAYEDSRRGEISNVLTLGTLALAPLLHVGRAIQHGESLAVAGLSGSVSILGALGCGIVPYVLFVKGGARGGDVKLCAALGAVLKPFIGIEVVFFGFLVAAILAPARLAYEGRLLSSLKSSLYLLVNPMLPKSRRVEIDPSGLTWVRMGPSFLIGMIVVTLLHWPELSR